ncbi:MAG TPA: alkaline phosphatase family protein [Nakamurella sp.]
MHDPSVPAYGADWLGALLPAAAAALGAPTGLPAFQLPATNALCVVLIDGLGSQLLAESADLAPFLAGLASAPGSSVRVGCPTTTATSMGSFGTGLSPGRHGLVGYEVLDPARGVLLNELRWSPDTDPLAWQPFPTLFEHLVAHGIQVTRIGNPEFADSGLTLAAHRGGGFVGVSALADRVTAALTMMTGGGRTLSYLYWGDLDTAGHQHGWRSPNWQAELGRVDRAVADLAARMPSGAVLVVTADHGMVDVPHARRLDLATAPGLRRGMAILGGEPRLAQLYCHAGAAGGVAARFSDVLGDRAWVRTRAEAIAAGWFGPVDDRVLPRIGDVLVAARDSFALVDSDVTAPLVLGLVGQHGSLTEAEQWVPMLVHVA